MSKVSKVSEVLKLVEFLGSDDAVAEPLESPYKIGKKYFVRTVTMGMLGLLKSVYKNELVFEKAAWIADTGRFNNFLSGSYNNSLEVEPFVNDVIVGRAAIVDATEWNNDLLKDQL